MEDIKILTKEKTEKAVKNEEFRILTENFAGIRSVERDPRPLNLQRVIDWSLSSDFALLSGLFADLGFPISLRVLQGVGKVDSPNNVETPRDNQLSS